MMFGTRFQADLRDILELDLPLVRRVDQELADAGCILAGIWRAPHIDVIGSTVFEDVSNLGPGDECRCRAAHIARFDAVAFGRCQVGFDFDLGNFLLQIDMEVVDALQCRRAHP